VEILKKMTNKKVIRITNQAGKFTTIHHSILFDQRLSPMALKVLIVILSDADTFNLSRESLVNRLKVDKKTIQLAFKNLEQAGYIARTELKRGHFYNISEFGNLNTNEKIELEPQAQVQEEIRTQVPEVLPTKIDIQSYISEITDALPEIYSDEDLVKFIDYLNDAIDTGRLTDGSQMTVDNLKKISKKLFPKAAPVNIAKLCDEYAGGHMITIGKKAEITKKVLSFFEKYDGQITEKLVKGRILSVKTAYQSTGHLDQRYQN
jgi:DNA-binding transcriptional regulator YhcF (GntR family)